MSDINEKVTRLKGKITKPIAKAAGDRRSEAKNAIEAETGSKPDPEAPELDHVEHKTRKRHGDI